MKWMKLNCVVPVFPLGQQHSQLCMGAGQALKNVLMYIYAVSERNTCVIISVTPVPTSPSMLLYSAWSFYG